MNQPNNHKTISTNEPTNHETISTNEPTNHKTISTNEPWVPDTPMVSHGFQAFQWLDHGFQAFQKFAFYAVKLSHCQEVSIKHVFKAVK